MSTTCNSGVNSVINVSLSNFILTPGSCALLVNEVIKNLLYQRSQIPYPYAWLKNIVNKKRRNLEEESSQNTSNFTLNRHYQLVSTVYDSAETIMADMIKIFTCVRCKLKEVIFVIGVTPVCPKEVLTIRISSMAHDHVERNHAAENSKKQQKILKDIFFDNHWLNLVEKSLPCSSVYIFLKLNGSKEMIAKEDNIFVPTKPLSLSHSVKHTIICLNYEETQMLLCCDNLEIFKDSNDVHIPKNLDYANVGQQSVENTEIWLQSKTSIKGFKDCFINKVSANELW